MSWNNSGPYPQNPYGGQQAPPYAGPPPSGYPGAPPYPGAAPAGYPPYPGAAPGGYVPQPGFQPPPMHPQYGGGGPEFGQPQGGYGGASGYEEDPEVKGFDFSDQSIRRGFIRKVYSILTAQLSISIAFIAWFLFHEPTQRFVYRNSWLLIIAIILVFASLIAIACCGELRRKAPMNFIFLSVFTLAESFVLAVGASAYKKDEVLLAVGITAAVCLALTLFAFQTKWDFTMMGGILFVAVVILFIFGIVTIFVHNYIVKMVYASLGALIFSIYLVYDTQMMMGGKHKYSISPEEYIFASLNLYIDIVNIFMYILTIIGASRD